MDTTHTCPLCDTPHDTYTLGCDRGLGCQHCAEDSTTLPPLPGNEMSSFRHNQP